MTQLLSIQELSCSFGGVKALQNIDLQVNKGLIFALIGPNGAGKTTLLNILTGLTPPSSGRISFKGTDITGTAAHKVADIGIARTFQSGRLFTRLSVVENVMVGGQSQLPKSVLSGVFSSHRTRRLQQSLNDDSLALLKRLGILHTANQSVTTLPYGHRRLVELARSLVSKPSLLLLDEPAAGLNAKEADGLVDILRDLQREGLSIVLIEHNMGLVMKVADQIAVLNFGKKIADATPAEVRSDPVVLEAYLGRGYGRA